MIEIHAERNLGCSATPEEDWSFSVSSRQLNVRGRSPGISGYMRLRNEVAFVDEAIASHLPFLDELVVVDNNSSDGTWECVQKWVQRAPDKIRAYRYLPTVQPLGTKGGLNLPTDHPSSFANYCNFALVQTRRQIAITIDGDHVAIASVFERAREFAVRNVNEKTYVSIFGINLVAHGRELYIANSYNYRAAPGVNEMRVGMSPFTHGEHAFFFVTPQSWYVMNPTHAFESMPLWRIYERGIRFTPVSFLHLKGVKPDHGTLNWRVKDHQDTLRKEWAENALVFSRRRVMTLTEARLLFPTFVKRVDLAAEVARLKGNHGLVVRDGLEQAGLNRLLLRARVAQLKELAKVVLRPVWRGVARLLGQIGARVRERARAVVQRGRWQTGA